MRPPQGRNQSVRKHKVTFLGTRTMKKQKNKQAIKASKLAKAKNMQNKIITVKNAEGEPDTKAEILIQNKINYTPKVSVIIPVYNVEEYLRECLDSVVNQTLKEIEIICVDDGSTDNSLEILKEYAKKDNRITVMVQKNSGSGISRNNGINNAKGEFIAFMDSDDFYPSRNTLENMYKKAKEHNVNICGGSLNQLKDGKIVTDSKLFEDGYTFEKEGIINYKDYQFDYGYWRFIYRRQFLKENQLYFPDYLRQQDPPFFIKAMATAQQFYALTEATYVYRISHKTIQWTERKSQDVTKGLYDCLLIAKKENYQKLYIRIAERLLNPYFINAFKLLNKGNGQYINESLKKLVTSIDYQLIYKNKLNYELPWFYKSIPGLCKVSIIIPVYNVENYLSECLDSIINQTYKELEIICINDGSTDNSLHILQEYAKRDKRIKIINQNNKGLSAARNTGLKYCSSEYIFFLDSDDKISLNTIELMYNAIINNKVDVVSINVQCFADEGITEGIFNSKQLWFKRYEILKGKNLIPTDIRKVICPCVWNKLYKTSIIIYNELAFPEGTIREDEAWFWSYMTYCKEIFCLDEKMYFYRQRKNSIMYSELQNKIYDILKIDILNVKMMKKRGILEKYKDIMLGLFIMHLKQIKGRIAQENLKTLNQYVARYLEYVSSSELQEFINNLYNPKISIIVPVYNVENYLKECLDSLINQTLKEIEIICVDDGSADNSLKILQEYAGQDKRIKVLTQKNKKQGAARNKGLSIAKGEYIQFVDADDYISLNACEKIYKQCSELNLEMISFGGINFDNKTKELISFPYYEFRYLPQEYENKVLNYKACKNFVTEMAVTTWCTVYEHKYIRKHNILFPENRYFEDNAFFTKAIVNVNRLFIDKNIYYYHRLHKESTTKNWNKHFQDYIQIADMNLTYLRSINIENAVYDKYKELYLRTCRAKYQSFSSSDKKKYEKMMINLFNKRKKICDIKSYISLLYNLCTIPLLFKKLIVKLLISMRIDIKNFGKADNDVDITTTAKTSAPAWFANEQGRGRVVESVHKKETLTLKCRGTGKLRLDFKATDKRCNGTRFPLWVDYKSIKINGKEQLTAPVATWHDKPYRFEMPVKDGQVINIEVAQQYHQYTKDELKDVILKLNPNSDYIRQNIKRLTDKIYNKITVKPSAPLAKKPKAASNQELLASISALNARIERLEQENRAQQAQILAAIKALGKQ